MVKAAHLKVSDSVLKDIQSQIDWKINRTAYLFGSIAPDLNCVYPMHTFNATLKRFKKRLWRMEKYNSVLIKSFTLGVITHYICDYFCYAHNIKQPNPKHAVYETIMQTHIMKHSKKLSLGDSELENQWKELSKHTMESIADTQNIGNRACEAKKALGIVSKQGIDHIEYIMNLIEQIHDSYIERTLSIDNNIWHKSINKIELDLKYAQFMCENIALMLMNPVEEISIENIGF